MDTKRNILQGQMLVHFNPLTMEAPKVWVKVSETDDTEPSLFIDNSAMVRFAINGNYKPGINERWLIGNRYYYKMVRKGEFVPDSDLNEASKVCEERGWPSYVIDF